MSRDIEYLLKQYESTEFKKGAYEVETKEQCKIRKRKAAAEDRIAVANKYYETFNIKGSMVERVRYLMTNYNFNGKKQSETIPKILAIITIEYQNIPYNVFCEMLNEANIPKRKMCEFIISFRRTYKLHSNYDKQITRMENAKGNLTKYKYDADEMLPKLIKVMKNRNL